MITLIEVVGYNEFSLIEAVFDERQDDASEPDLRTRLVLDDPAHLYRQLIAEWEAEGNTIPAYDPAPAPDTPYRLFKSTFIRRMTESEAEVMEGALAEAPAKLRLMFNSVEYFVSDDPLFDELRGAVIAALGETRAEELLAIDA